MKTGKYLITGRQGSGKTTVGKELASHGYTVYDIDHTDGLGMLRELATDKLFRFDEIVSTSLNGTIDWSKYWYELQKDKLEEVLASDDTVFVTGIASNGTQLYDSFDKVFVLVVDPETVRHRLRNHEHAAHHLPSEIDRILTDFDQKQQVLIDGGDNTVRIDANGSMESIIEAIRAQMC